MTRSYLFVPGNRPERFAKAIACGAGAVILDLEDAVPAAGKHAARAAVCQWLHEHDGAAWVRVNGTDTEYFADDARALGFGAKLCIHPNQIDAVERGFAPSDEDMRWARAVVDAFERAGGSAVRLEGKLIDLPVVERARRMLG